LNLAYDVQISSLRSPRLENLVGRHNTLSFGRPQLNLSANFIAIYSIPLDLSGLNEFNPTLNAHLQIATTSAEKLGTHTAKYFFNSHMSTRDLLRFLSKPAK